MSACESSWAEALFYVSDQPLVIYDSLTCLSIVYRRNGIRCLHNMLMEERPSADLSLPGSRLAPASLDTCVLDFLHQGVYKAIEG